MYPPPPPRKTPTTPQNPVPTGQVQPDIVPNPAPTGQVQPPAKAGDRLGLPAELVTPPAEIKPAVPENQTRRNYMKENVQPTFELDLTKILSTSTSVTLGQILRTLPQDKLDEMLQIARKLVANDP